MANAMANRAAQNNRKSLWRKAAQPLAPISLILTLIGYGEGFSNASGVKVDPVFQWCGLSGRSQRCAERRSIGIDRKGDPS
jgi:hypothetical protein